MPRFRQCSLAQESNLGEEGTKESIASSRSPRGFQCCRRSVYSKEMRDGSELTIVHVLLSPSLDQKVLCLGSQMWFSTKLSVANVANSVTETMQ